jgi:hypothetical protein
MSAASSTPNGCGRLLGFAAASVLAALFTSAPASAADCFGRLRRPLERGGYSPSMDCRELEVIIKDIGVTKPRHGPTYHVYQLSYRTRTHGWGTPHGGDRILIFDAHGQYLGHYYLMRGQRLRIVGTDVVFALTPRWGNRIHLDGAHPPDPAWIDGDLVGFER